MKEDSIGHKEASADDREASADDQEASAGYQEVSAGHSVSPSPQGGWIVTVPVNGSRSRVKVVTDSSINYLKPDVTSDTSIKHIPSSLFDDR